MIRRPLIVFAAFVFSLIVSFALVSWWTGSGRVTQAVIGGPFTLVNQEGKSVTQDILRGKVTLMFFGFTHCPDICPTALFEISEIMRALGKDADKTAALFVTVDPERDTPAVMKNYISSFDPHIGALSGDAEAIARMLKAYRVYAKKVPLKSDDYTMDHSAAVYLMDRNGTFVSTFNIKRSAADAAADLRRYF